MTVENMSKRIGKNLFALVVPALLLLTACGAPAYQRLVVLGDPHIPGNHLEVKQQALDDINSWPDVKLVVAVGDICSLYGTDEEYAAAKEFFARLNKPMAIIDGNHDFIYATPAGQEGGFMPGSSESKQEKLEKFAKIFGQPGLYFSRQLGEYLLVFLAADNEDYQIGITDSQLGWLRQELAAHPKSPTIIFFHAPLVGTLRNYRPWVNQPGAVAQPSEQLREILAANRQVFLWVSGHTHTSLQEESYASPINLYDGRVTNIHNTDMNKGEIWTNSLYLYPDKVVVRTFSHRQQAWLPKFDRTILPPEP
jgi:predicted phosphodiesterase